jgi:ketosteroid isomerase-like protein
MFALTGGEGSRWGLVTRWVKPSSWFPQALEDDVRMRPGSSRSGFLAASFVLVAVAGAACAGEDDGRASAPEVDLEQRRAEVLAAEDAMNEAVDGLDCDAGMAWIADDAEHLFVANAVLMRTKPELTAMCAEMVAPRTGAVFSIDDRSVRMLSEASALVVREGTYTVDYVDGTSEELFLVMSSVWERDAEGWKMVHLHESYMERGDAPGWRPGA